MTSFEESLATFVTNLLCRHLDQVKPLRGGRIWEKAKPREVHCIFADLMESSTIDRLRMGKAISDSKLIAFAGRLGLDPVNSAELFIRWGESKLGSFTYRGPDTPLGDDQPNRRDRQKRLLGMTQSELMHFLSRTPTAHHGGDGSPGEELRKGLRRLAQSQGKELIELREGDRKGFNNFLEKGVMIRPRAFNAVITKCLIRPPGPNAPKAQWQAHFQRELTADKLRAHYIEAALNRHILAISPASWSSFELDVHCRLLAWVLACYEPFEHNGSSISPYYFVQKTVAHFGGIGHGSRPFNSQP